ncbi:hypothetical protein [Nocardia terpenica]|uniref:DUF8020 domain-containing protein n=1 Tax=Nocardia terpenica TaxID=455432 RepID=A0A161XJD1_9NOCA|nr:hypothetical protein [Nocardia terpenica]KZM73898.1 hypothetical protein AWN90_35810 [Nocardia terpenica]NQE86815.1 hypothetical protein [Nocardia terpenica]
MSIRSTAVVAALTVTALAGATATADAQPTPPIVRPAAAESGLPSLPVEARIADGAVRLHTDLGTLRVADNQLQIIDPHEIVIGRVPLTIVRDGTAYPIDARADEHTALLTPRPDRAYPTAADIAGDSFEDRLNTAMSNANNELTVALAVGTLLGAIIGGPIGCIALGAAGGAATGSASLGALAAPGALAGCLTGAVTGAGMGVIVFDLLIGVPALIATAIHFLTTMTAPPAPDAGPADN